MDFPNQPANNTPIYNRPQEAELKSGNIIYVFLRIAGKLTISYNLKIMKEKIIIPIILGALAAYVYKFTGSLAINLVIAGCISAFVVRANRLKSYLATSLIVAVVIGISFAVVFVFSYPDSQSTIIRMLALFSVLGVVVSFSGLILGVVFRSIWERRLMFSSR